MKYRNNPEYYIDVIKNIIESEEAEDNIKMAAIQKTCEEYAKFLGSPAKELYFDIYDKLNKERTYENNPS